MNVSRFLSLPLAALLAAALHGPACAAPDPAQYTLTPAVMKKFESMQKEAEAIEKKRGSKEGEDDAAKPEESLDDFVRRLERDAQLKALLARHGMTPTDFALATHAMLHAGMYVAFESSMDKKKAAELYKTYTPAQKANIELMRKLPKSQ